MVPVDSLSPERLGCLLQEYLQSLAVASAEPVAALTVAVALPVVVAVV